MTDLFSDPEGATPLGQDDLDGLIPTWVATRAELNEVEERNISQAQQWAARRTWTLAAILDTAAPDRPASPHAGRGVDVGRPGPQARDQPRSRASRDPRGAAQPVSGRRRAAGRTETVAMPGWPRTRCWAPPTSRRSPGGGGSVRRLTPEPTTSRPCVRATAGTTDRYRLSSAADARRPRSVPCPGRRELLDRGQESLP